MRHIYIYIYILSIKLFISYRNNLNDSDTFESIIVDLVSTEDHYDRSQCKIIKN